MKLVELDAHIGKVKMNYAFYNGSDLYSDGDIENEILAKLMAGVSESDLISQDKRWPILYHFSPIRKNILEWYDFRKDASVLEIGAGCGAITGELCQKSKRVVAVDLSKQRCLINAYRNKECDNLELVIANFQDLQFEEKFDYITLIGVLEYAAAYIDGGRDSFRIFLKKIKGMLREDGKLIVAIENKVGLKYWNGAGEDHIGRMFEGIENYPSPSQVETFSKQELEALLNDAGYRRWTFYYPYPDYKFPEQIFSEKYLPQPGALIQKEGSCSEERFYLFNENAARDTLIKASLFEEMANSFLVIADA